MPILRSSPPFTVHTNIFRSFPSASAVRKWPACPPNASLRHPFSSSTARYLTRCIIETPCLDSQIAYVPPIAADPKPASRVFGVQEGAPSLAILMIPLHPPLPQDTHDPQSGSARESPADAILIRSDDKSSDLDSRSDTSFESLYELITDVCNKVAPGRVAWTGMCLDLTFFGRPTC